MNIKPFIIELPEFSSVEVMCVGDFHIGDSNHSSKIMNDIATWVNEKDNRFIIIDGDIFNAALKSSVSDVYSEKLNVDECMAIFGEFIDSVGADNILVCIDGNHDKRVWKAAGIDPVKYVCHTKNVRYRNNEAYLTIKVGAWCNRTKDKPRMVTYRLFVTHGIGGGRSSGGKLNNLMSLANIVVADIYVQGHQHDPVIKPRVVYEWDGQCKNVVEHQQMFVVTGSCLERGGYAEEKAYAPVSTKSPVLVLSGKRKDVRAAI